ncbi:MAG: hypothetical protein ACXVA4_12305 [Ktedonobacterales bacterium]
MTTQPKTPTNAPGMANLPSEESLDGNELAHNQEERSRETRPLPAVDMAATADVSDTSDTTETPTSDTPASAADAAAAAPAPQHPDITAVHQGADADGDATLLRPAVRPEPDATLIRPAIEPRPRKNTLASAFTPPTARPRGESVPPPPPAPQLPAAVPDEIDDEVDEWAAADQPTVYLAPRPMPQSQPRPAYLETGESEAWPARPTPPPPTRPRTPEPQRLPQPPQQPNPPAMPGGPQTQRPSVGSRPASPLVGQPRLATPTGRPVPGTPPLGVPRSALPDPRMERFQVLRQQRLAHEDGERAPNEPPSVATAVRQWWSDLLPNLQNALTYQREARASGVHPIPAYEPTPTSRLGDAFGRLTATARDLTERAQAAASPTLKRLHNQAEHAAQAIVERIEGPTARQQAPLLGPGRIAIFFRQGVTVGQAQALLSASHARPIRLIPRKHGFLTLVTPGMEAEIGGRLREHPYVRDVAYLEYDQYGQPIEPR